MSSDTTTYLYVLILKVVEVFSFHYWFIAQKFPRSQPIRESSTNESHLTPDNKTLLMKEKVLVA
jgi:hypothetical protein